MTRSACFSKWLLLASLGIGACGSDASLLIIEVSSRPASVQSLRLTATLNGNQSPAEYVKDSLDDFGLLLPPEASGPFRLTAEGLDIAGCTTATGRTDTTLTGHDRVRLSLAMSALRIPYCKSAP